jgi:hypothetical protein
LDQKSDDADPRLLDGCIYCGALPDSRDHVPSKCFLDRPYPENLPVVPACRPCNSGFSTDEQYLACLIEVILCGSTDPDALSRSSVARTLRRDHKLRAQLNDAQSEQNGQVVFSAEMGRVENVMLMLARGHAAFELSQPCRDEPDHFWCGPLMSLDSETRGRFDAPHQQQLIGEVGSRGSQRMMITQLTLQSPSGELTHLNLTLTDWIEVQPDSYRFLAVDDVGGIVIRIVMSEYLACEVAWKS